jgi:hypothetical protein
LREWGCDFREWEKYICRWKEKFFRVDHWELKCVAGAWLSFKVSMDNSSMTEKGGTPGRMLLLDRKFFKASEKKPMLNCSLFGRQTWFPLPPCVVLSAILPEAFQQFLDSPSTKVIEIRNMSFCDFLWSSMVFDYGELSIFRRWFAFSDV